MRLPSLVCVLFLLAATAGCDSKSGHEAVADDIVVKMQEMLGVVKGITDEQSAKAARPKMVALKKDVDELKARADKMGKASAATERRMQEKHGKELQRLTGEMQTEMMRIIQDPKIAPHMRETMQGL
jgi:hypothetical protein